MSRLLGRSIVGLTFVFLLAPIIVVVLSSFSAGSVLSFPPRSFTTQWYRGIDRGYYDALMVSLAVALLTVAVALVLGVPAALALARGRFPGRGFLNAVCLSPLMVPGLVIGIGAFQFALLIWDGLGLTLLGTRLGLVLGHLTFAVPLVIRSVLSAHAEIDMSIEEAALNLGATPLQTLVHVTLPTLRQGIVSGAVLVFLLSMDEVPIALFMGGGEATTLPVMIFSAMEINFGGEILAVASLVVLGSVVVMLLLEALIGLEHLLASRH